MFLTIPYNSNNVRNKRTERTLRCHLIHPFVPNEDKDNLKSFLNNVYLSFFKTKTSLASDSIESKAISAACNHPYCYKVLLFFFFLRLLSLFLIFQLCCLYYASLQPSLV